MDSARLRELQAPLKAKYREDVGAALVTLRAEGSLDAEGIACRVDTEVLNTEHAAVVSKWHFAPGDGKLLGGEVTIAKEDDPCEIYFADYRAVDGRQLPHRLEVRYGNEAFGVVTVKNYTVK